MDYEFSVFGQLEPDDLEQVAGAIGPDCEYPRWVRLGVEVDDHEGVRDSMQDCLAVDAMLVRRAMQLHT